eukprot:4410382-Pleurochrysis_carterae.AAC.1
MEISRSTGRLRNALDPADITQQLVWLACKRVHAEGERGRLEQHSSQMLCACFANKQGALQSV